MHLYVKTIKKKGNLLLLNCHQILIIRIGKYGNINPINLQ